VRDYWKLLLAVLACLLGLAGMWSGRPIARAPGVLAEGEPVQTPARGELFELNDFHLEAQAAYDITARVLSVERYRMDGGANLAPIDFAVGWGPMSDSAVLEHFKVTQGARFFTIYPDEEAIDLATALQSSANMHIIPANSLVMRQLKKARSGSLVHLQGFLVNASTDEGFTWHSSLTRNDTGDGACELFYVDAAELR
jgi:hypothetical protein